MSKIHNDEFFNYFISGMEEELQGQLRYLYARNSILNEYEHRQEMERMKKEITEDVLSRISIMFETGEAIDKINALNEAIEQLER